MQRNSDEGLERGSRWPLRAPRGSPKGVPIYPPEMSPRGVHGPPPAGPSWDPLGGPLGPPGPSWSPHRGPFGLTWGPARAFPRASWSHRGRAFQKAFSDAPPSVAPSGGPLGAPQGPSQVVLMGPESLRGTLERVPA
eukprot:9499713-Pyramimonas_sp.AAC.1